MFLFFIACCVWPETHIAIRISMRSHLFQAKVGNLTTGTFEASLMEGALTEMFCG